LAELFGAPVAEGTVATMTKRAVDGLEDFLSLVRGRIIEAGVAGFDETGLRWPAACTGCIAPAPRSTP
jgi:transposase